MSEIIADAVHCSETKSNGEIGGMSPIKSAAEFAKTSVIVNGVSVVVGDVFGGGSGGSLDRLKKRHPIAQFDGIVRFDDSHNPATGEARHDYYVMEKYGERLFHGSCTGLIEKYFPQFDAEGAYKGMERKGRFNDPDDEYYGMSKEEVLAQWSDTGLRARNDGSAMHKTIEAFLNNCHDVDWPIWESPENKPALDRFLRFWRTEIVGKLIPWRTEMIMFDRRFEFAGQADFVYKRAEWLVSESKANWIGIGDWKRSKKTFNELPYKGQTGFGRCDSLPAVPLSKYRLQMSLYGSCMMRQTSYEVHELCLGIFHEAHADYRWVVTEPLFGIADAMLVERRQLSVAKYLDTALRLSHYARSTIEQHLDDDEDGYSDGALMQDAVRSLDGLVRDMAEFGASTEQILGVAKRKKM